jgi:hypothetical protein
MRHNKKRNTALLYEFLIRHISKCMVENKHQEAQKAISLLRKYFGKQTLLREELRLFNSLTNTTLKTPEFASKALAEVLRSASLLNHKALFHVKSKLIKEMHALSPEIYASKIPYYSFYASVGFLFEECRQPFLEAVQKIKLEERVVRHLSADKAPKQSLLETLKLDPKYTDAVYRNVLQKFNDKYAGLPENQKRLLTKYAVSLISENQAVFSNALTKEVNRVRDSLSCLDRDLLADKELLQRISECRDWLDGAKHNSRVDEQGLVRVLQFMTLADEVSSKNA